MSQALSYVFARIALKAQDLYEHHGVGRIKLTLTCRYTACPLTNNKEADVFETTSCFSSTGQRGVPLKICV